MISFVITLILAGSVFITCGLFNEMENPPKEYFVIITVSLLLIVCLAMRKGLGKLEKSLQSSSLKTGIAVVCLLTSVHGFLQYLGILPSRIPAFSIVGTSKSAFPYCAADDLLRRGDCQRSAQGIQAWQQRSWNNSHSSL